MTLAEIRNLQIINKNEILFNKFNLQLNEGECIGLFAPTGKGKTTLLNYLAGIIPRKSGFEISGELIKSQDLKISYVFQNLGLIQYFPVIENVLLPMKNICSDVEGIDRAKYWLEKLFLGDKINDNVLDLSGGEKQRVSLARAFVYPGKLLLLDEPFSYQDSTKKESLINITADLIEAEKRSAIMVSHSKEELTQICSKILTEKDFYCK